MKKIVILVGVLVLLLVVAPLGVGRLAEKRVDHGLEQLVKAAPYLKVVESKYTAGWFKSDQVVTFEAFGSWMQAFSPKVLEEAMKKESASPEAAVESEVDAAVAASPDAVPEDAPPQDADSSAAEKPDASSATPESPLRFTVRNEILHGPVLGFSGFGIARVNSHLVLSEETHKKIAEIFGPKDPLEISTRIGFFGGGTTTFKSEGRTIKPKDKKAEISWDTFKLAIGYSSNADRYDIDGKLPKVEVKGLEDKSQFLMTDMTMDGDSKRVHGDLYDGDITFAVAKVAVVGKDSAEFELQDLSLVENIGTKGDFTGVSAKLGSGQVKSKDLTKLGIELKEIHYDIGVRRLHAPTLEKIIAGMKEMYGKPLTNVAEMNKVMFAPLKESGAELLKYDPEFVIDRIGFATADGDGYIKGLVTLKGATAEDFATGSMGLIGKIHADITVDVSEKMIQKFPNGSTAGGAAVDSGYAKREGGRLICKIVFVDGKLTVNGKPQAIPGLGGPPAEGTPPPQE
jgi:uncharacterized protein YdgA (DUF945 family)